MGYIKIIVLGVIIIGLISGCTQDTPKIVQTLQKDIALYKINKINEKNQTIFKKINIIFKDNSTYKILSNYESLHNVGLSQNIEEDYSIGLYCNKSLYIIYAKIDNTKKNQEIYKIMNIIKFATFTKKTRNYYYFKPIYEDTIKINIYDILYKERKYFQLFENAPSHTDMFYRKSNIRLDIGKAIFQTSKNLYTSDKKFKKLKNIPLINGYNLLSYDNKDKYLNNSIRYFKINNRSDITFYKNNYLEKISFPCSSL